PGCAVDDGRAVLLGQATADGDLHPGIRILGGAQCPQGAVQLVVGVLPHRAGVEHHHVHLAAARIGVCRGSRVPGRLEHPGPPLGIPRFASLSRRTAPRVPYSSLSASSRAAQVLNTTTSTSPRRGSASAGAAVYPAVSSIPVRRSESWTFIWQPKVRTW